MKKRLLAFLCILGMVLTMPGCASEEKNGEALSPHILDDKYRTFYEVFVYSFYDSDGDGIGDLRGLTQKLDYINDGDDATTQDLGCNGIWLMPIMPSPTYHKYDVSDYMAVDPAYGDMEDFEAFMEACRERNIDVLIDLVINHTSSSHPWFIQACDYLRGLGDGEPDTAECPYVEYYNFTKEKKSGVYYPVSGTDWYYEAPFWSEMPDLNLDSRAVRDEIAEITGFWLDKGVAGFRLDAAKEYVSDNTSANVEILAWLNETVKARKEDAYMVAEVWTDISTYAQYYESGIDSMFNFRFASQDGIIAGALNGTGGNSAVSFGQNSAALAALFSAYGTQYIDAPFYTNHDMGRSAGYYAGEGSEEKTKMAQAMNLLMTGNAFLYYGEELGMKGAGKDENKRAPMYWSADRKAEGMCNGPEYMDDIKMKFPSLEEQQADENSIYQYVKKVIQLRNAFPEIARGETEYLEEISDEGVCVLRKTYEGSQIVLVYNLSGEAGTFAPGEAQANGKTLEKQKPAAELYTGTEEISEENGLVTLPAYSVLLYK